MDIFWYIAKVFFLNANGNVKKKMAYKTTKIFFSIYRKLMIEMWSKSFDDAFFDLL